MSLTIRRLTFFLLAFTTGVPLAAQMKFSVTTDKSFYQYGDSVKITIKAVNEGDTPDTLYLTPCDVNYYVGNYDLFGHRPCPTIIIPYAIPPHDSVSWGSGYLPPFPATDTLAAGRLAVVGELDDYWMSDTLWVNVLSNAVAAADSLFPLEKGDFWQYRVITEDQNDTVSEAYGTRRVLGDTTCANGLTYDTVLDSNVTYSGAAEELLRVDSLTGCVYQLTNGAEQKIDSLEMEKGDELDIGYGVGFPLYCISVDTESAFGSKRITKSFSWSYGVIDVTGIEYKYAAGVGMLGRWWSGGTDEMISIIDNLVYAKISGIGYGRLVGVQTRSVPPSTFDLEQNYPNPFNPTTVIQFNVPRSGFVSLEVYDVLGREVRTLVNRVEQPGSYSVTFNASGLSSGVYFYRLVARSLSGKAEMYRETKKLLLLK